MRSSHPYRGTQKSWQSQLLETKPPKNRLKNEKFVFGRKVKTTTQAPAGLYFSRWHKDYDCRLCLSLSTAVSLRYIPHYANITVSEKSFAESWCLFLAFNHHPLAHLSIALCVAAAVQRRLKHTSRSKSHILWQQVPVSSAADVTSQTSCRRCDDTDVTPQT